MPIVPLPQIRPSSQVFAGWELTNPRCGTGRRSEATDKVVSKDKQVCKTIRFMIRVLL
jgi:hypothetical protein